MPKPYLPQTLHALGLKRTAFIANEIISRRRRGLTDAQMAQREDRGNAFVDKHAKLCIECKTALIPGWRRIRHFDCYEWQRHDLKVTREMDKRLAAS